MKLPATIDKDVTRALDEDLGNGDVTASLITSNTPVSARIISREAAVLAGTPWAQACFEKLDPEVQIHWYYNEGDTVAANTDIGEIYGKAKALVSAERTALNFLQLLSGTATTTQDYVKAVSHTSTRILDTRKTLPGLRQAQKYAVRCGGGYNHRMGLFDQILIKENHITAAGGIQPAIEHARKAHPDTFLICEVESIEELEQAIAAQADRIMLDEFSHTELCRAVRLTNKRIPLEVSGNVNLASLTALADTGVDYISIGALTKHVNAVDLSMRITASRSH